MRAGIIGRAGGLDDGQALRVVKRLERRERRVQSEKAVEVNRRARSGAGFGPGGAGPGNGDGRAQAVIVGLAVRNDHVEAVNRAALKDGDQQLAPRADGRRRAAEKRRREAKGQHSHLARFEEDSEIHHD